MSHANIETFSCAWAPHSTRDSGYKVDPWLRALVVTVGSSNNKEGSLNPFIGEGFIEVKKCFQ